MIKVLGVSKITVWVDLLQNNVLGLLYNYGDLYLSIDSKKNWKVISAQSA